MKLLLKLVILLSFLSLIFPINQFVSPSSPVLAAPSFQENQLSLGKTSDPDNQILKIRGSATAADANNLVDLAHTVITDDLAQGTPQLNPNGYALCISVDGAGTTNPPTGTYTYPRGANINIMAASAPGWQFLFWSSDNPAISGSRSPDLFMVLKQDYSICAHFMPNNPAIRPDVTSSAEPDTFAATMAAGIGSISGLVYEADGVTPIAGAFMYASSNSSSGYGFTGFDGSYTITGLPSGNYTVYSQASGYITEYYNDTFESTLATLVSVTAPNNTPNINFTMNLPGSISGHVYKADGVTPITDATLYASSNLFSGYASTASDGSYSLSGLPSGNYTIYAQAPNYIKEYYKDTYDPKSATPVSVTAPNSISDINFALDIGGAISGNVTTANGVTPITTAILYASSNLFSGYTTTASDGSYSIAGLPSGNYTIYAQAQNYIKEYYKDTYDPKSATPVSVTAPNSISDINFTLDIGGTISGNVTMGNGMTPIAGAVVFAGSNMFTSSCSANIIGNGTTTASDGSYTITGLPPGNFMVEASASGYAMKFYKDTYDYTLATLVGVTAPNNTPNINFSLDPGGNISGYVYRADGVTPIGSTLVMAMNSGLHFDSGIDTDTNGSYSISGLPSGNYTVSAEGSFFIPKYYNDTIYSHLASPVGVMAPNNTPNINFTLDPGGNISGYVYKADGVTPIPGALIHISSNSYDVYASTTCDGSYSTTGLPSGNYTVSASASGYIGQFYKDAANSNSATQVGVTISNNTSNVNFNMLQGSITYTLTYTAGANGSISGNTSQTVAFGGSGTAVTAVPNAGYHFVNWSDSSSANPRTDSGVSADISVTANFAINSITYTLTYTAGANGSISGNTSQTVAFGGSGTAVTAVPNAGYHFVNWSDSSTANPRTDSGVSADISVTANFAINSITYTLTYSAGANGSISGNTSQTVAFGGSGTAVTAVPNAGYHFVNWSDSSSANPRTDSGVSADISVTANFAINIYTLTYTAGANGSISGNTSQTVAFGGSGTAVTAVPNAGYHFVNWSDSSTANPRIDSGVSADISVTANFAINIYTLTYTAGANGSISGNTSQTVAFGGSGTAVTAVPNAGYHFVNWSDSSTANPRTDSGVSADISVTANFAINSITYTLTYSAGANGSISGNTSQTVAFGGSGTAVTAVPNAGYHFVNWSDSSSANPRTDSGVSADISVTANFAINIYTLTYTAGANGSISGNTSQTVAFGGSGTAVTAVPNAGYHFVNWSDSSTANPRTDSGVSADISVTANFAINSITYTLTYTAGANGSISGNTSQTVAFGGSGTAVTAVPNAGYHFVNWSDSSSANPRTDSGVSADISVTANFAINSITYTLTYTAGANGSISGNTSQTVAFGGSGTAVTAVPNAGYHFVNWSDSSTANPRTDSGVSADISVTANFAINIYTLTYTAGANGSISGNTSQTVAFGGSGTAVTAVPNAGYHFVNWSDSSTANPRTDSGVSADISVTANFAINSITYTLTYTAGANGSISGNTSQTVAFGGSGTAVTAVPNAGYHFVNWSDSSTANPRTDSGVSADISVTANFAPYVAVPTVVNISPSSGPAAGGTSVTINGTGFVSGNTTVTIGGTAATGVIFGSVTSIMATTPAGMAGAQDVVVTTPGGSATLPGSFTYVAPPINAVPTLTLLNPNWGAQGVSLIGVNVTGTNLTGAVAVTFSGTGVTASNLVVNGAGTQITADITIAANALLGAQNVTVTATGGTSAALVGGFTVIAASTPTLTSLSPNSGVQGATLTGVIINGTNLTGTTAVSFNGTGVTASSIVVVNAAQITATITIAANAPVGPLNVTVTATGGTSPALVGGFTLVAIGAPTLTSLSPNTGVQGATLNGVVINGTNLAGATAVTFSGNGVTASNLLVNGIGTQITATINITANAPAGSQNVTVIATAGTSAALVNGFTIVSSSAPTVTSITPNSGVQGSTISVSVSGANMTGATAVNFSNTGVTATNLTVVNAAQINAIVTINSAASIGSCDVSVTNASEGTGAPLSGGFTVFAYVPPQGGGGGVYIVVPKMNSITPATGATGMAVNAPITAVFSVPMDPSTLTTTTFTVMNGTSPVTGTIAYDDTTYTATFTPSAPLAYNTLYTVTITTGAKNTSGHGLSRNLVSTFTTAAAPTPIPTLTPTSTPAPTLTPTSTPTPTLTPTSTPTPTLTPTSTPTPTLTPTSTPTPTLTPTSTPTPTLTPTSTPTPTKTFPLALVIGIIAAVVVVITVILVIRRRGQ